MPNTTLESLGGGRFRVSGRLNAASAAEILKQSETVFANTQRIEIDLAGVVESDSSGLALLIEWLRLARQSAQKLHFVNLPPQISALARISEVEDLLAANEIGA